MPDVHIDDKIYLRQRRSRNREQSVEAAPRRALAVEEYFKEWSEHQRRSRRGMFYVRDSWPHYSASSGGIRFQESLCSAGESALSALTGIRANLGKKFFAGRALKRDYEALLEAVAKARFWHDRWIEDAQKEHDQRVDRASAALKQTMDRTQQRLSGMMPGLRQAISELAGGGESASPGWGSAFWDSWEPASRTIPICRLGKFPFQLPDAHVVVPAFVALPGERSLLFKAIGGAENAAVAAVQSLMLRLLAQIPPGKLNFTFVDPVGLGQSVAPFMALADYDESLVGGRAWSDSQHIEQRLADLTEHMENVIQKYLRGQYATIEDYNAQAEVPEAYRVLVVTGFPVNFSEVAARRLVSIAQNGPRCGVFAIVVADPDQPSPYGFDLADLERVATTIAWRDERWVWEDDDFRDCLLTLDEPPDAKLFVRIIQTVGEKAKDAKRVEVPFARVAPAREAWWAADSSAGLRVPLGPAGANKLQYLDLGQGTAQHTLVVGKTGSGKSTLLHAMITGLALAYSPEEVQLYLIDFKKGVEFKTYADQALPHARVIAIESEREFGLSVVQGLDAELKQRGDLFRAAGVDGLADYRRKAGKALPRILLLVDEFQEFFTEDDSVASQSSQILDRLVRQGRAFGIHVLLGSQTLAGAYSLARSTIDQMAVRVALQCSEADSRLILADDNPAARLLSRPGEAIYNAANGMVEGNNTFQVAWLPDEERDRYLKALHELAEQRGYRPSQIVFEGNAPAEIAQNRPLGDLLDGREPSAPARAPLAWLGEPVAIKDPSAAIFRRQSGGNLLIAGQNDEAALGMLLSSLVSLAAQQRFISSNGMGDGSQFYILDFGAADAPYAGLLRRLPELLQRPVRVAGRRDLPEVIEEIAAEVDRRLESDDSGAPPIYLAIFGLQRARDLRLEDEFAMPSFSSFPGDEPPPPPSPAKRFPTILREGPDLGVHTIVWCDTLTNLNT